MHAAPANGMLAAEIGAPMASAVHTDAAVAKPQLPKNRDGLAAALRALGVELRYNERASRAEYRQRGEWRELTDLTEASLVEEIAARFDTQTTRGPVPLRFGRERRMDALNAILDTQRVDPFIAWLEELPPWDGVPRVKCWLSNIFETDESDPLVSWASRFIFLGATWRAFKPGVKLDEMPVLIGPQGIGKSTALRLALPPEHPDWFADGLHLAADPKVRAEALQGRVLVEAAEMAGSTRAELESLKSFLSRTDDGAVRLAYRRNPQTMLRRCIIVGTTNSGEPLPNDPTGNRRFVPIRLEDGDPMGIADYMQRNRAQLWAEALTLYHKGAQAWLPRDLTAEQSKASERHRHRDPIIEDQIEELPADFTGTLAEIADRIGMVRKSGHAAKLSMGDTKRLAAALQAQGFKRAREYRDRRQVKMWTRVQ